jgi:pyruvate dehydrogenase E2 component (dihydrolipoamide acetyltransferase)
VAKALGVDLRRVAGSGPLGRIYRRDVEAVASAPAMAPAPADQAEVVIPLTSLRRAIIKKTTETLAIPYGALSRLVRADNLLAFRAALAEPFQKKHGLRLGLTHLLFKAAAAALREAPELNSRLAGEAIVRSGQINLGMVVTAPDGGGILIPVIRDVAAKSLGQIAQEWAGLTGRVEAGTQTLDDLSGGTFTVSNVGALGIDFFTPLIHPPESAILGVSRVRDEAVAEEGRLIVGRTLTLIVGADHRVFDAEPIGRFLGALDRVFQNPAELLI